MEWNVHVGPVNAIELSGGLLNIFTGGADSVIVGLRPKLVRNGKEKALVSKHDTTQLNGLSMVPQSYLELQTEELTQLQDSIKNLESDHFKLDKIQKEYEETLMQMNCDFEKNTADIRMGREQLVAREESAQNYWNNQREEIERDHDEKLISQNERFNRMLTEEFSKYEALKQQLDTTKEKYTQQRDSLLESHTDVICSAEKDYEARLSQMLAAYSELEHGYLSNQTKYKSMLSQTDEDYKQHIQEQHTQQVENIDEKRHTAKLYLRRHAKLARDNTNIHQEIQELKEKSQVYNEQNEGLAQETASITAKLQELEHEMERREETIKKKENTIRELRSLHNHLQNFRFVLDQKIKSLKDEKQPMERQHEALQKHIKNLFSELLDEHNSHSSNSSAHLSFKGKNLEALQTNQRLREKLLVANRRLEQLFSDLSSLFSTKHSDDLILQLRDVYYKHVGKEDLDAGGHSPTSIAEVLIQERQHNIQQVKVETYKQVEFMQDTLNKVNRNKDILETEQTRQLLAKQEENAKLVRECYDIRQEKELLLKKKADIHAAIKRMRLARTTPAVEQPLRAPAALLTPFQQYHQSPAAVWKPKQKPDPRMKHLLQQLERNRSEYNKQNRKLSSLVSKEGTSHFLPKK